MAHDVPKRSGRIVRVTIDGVTREKEYGTVSHAKRAYIALMFSKKARERFVRSHPSA